MKPVTIFHNPKCSTSVHAVLKAEELGVEAEIVLYLKSPPSVADLEAILDKLEDPPTALVRRDKLFAELGLGESDVATRAQVLQVLEKHKALLQRPLLVTKKKAIIGRPKDRVATLLTPLAAKK